MKISLSVSTAFRWLSSIPIAWITFTALTAFFNENLQLSFLPFSTKTIHFLILTISFFIGAFIGSSIFLKILPKYQKQFLFAITLFFIGYQATEVASLNLEYFLTISAFILGSFLAFSVSKKGLHIKVKV